MSLTVVLLPNCKPLRQSWEFLNGYKDFFFFFSSSWGKLFFPSLVLEKSQTIVAESFPNTQFELAL